METGNNIIRWKSFHAFSFCDCQGNVPPINKLPLRVVNQFYWDHSFTPKPRITVPSTLSISHSMLQICTNLIYISHTFGSSRIILYSAKNTTLPTGSRPIVILISLQVFSNFWSGACLWSTPDHSQVPISKHPRSALQILHSTDLAHCQWKTCHVLNVEQCNCHVATDLIFNDKHRGQGPVIFRARARVIPWALSITFMSFDAKMWLSAQGIGCLSAWI